MIDASKITKQIKDTLLADVNVAENFNGRIYRNVFVNEDPNFTPWLGIYRNDKDYSPWTTGSRRNWKGLIKVRLVLQVASLQDGEDAETLQEALEKKVLDCIHNNKRLNGEVDMLVDCNISYAFATTTSGVLMTNANIDLTYEVRTDG